MSDQVQHITRLDEYLEVTGKFPCVAKFTAPAWCGPCRALAPKFEELAAKYGNIVKFVLIDIDHASAIAKHMAIRSVPMVVFYEDGIRNDDLLIRGYKPDDLENSVVKLVEKYNSQDSESSESEEVSESEEISENPPEYDSDPSHNEYGEDCNFVIEKTADLLE